MASQLTKTVVGLALIAVVTGGVASATAPLTVSTSADSVDPGETVTIEVSGSNVTAIEIEDIPRNWTVVDRTQIGFPSTGETYVGWLWSTPTVASVSATFRVPETAAAGPRALTVTAQRANQTIDRSVTISVGNDGQGEETSEIEPTPDNGTDLTPTATTMTATPAPPSLTVATGGNDTTGTVNLSVNATRARTLKITSLPSNWSVVAHRSPHAFFHTGSRYVGWVWPSADRFRTVTVVFDVSQDHADSRSVIVTAKSSAGNATTVANVSIPDTMPPTTRTTPATRTTATDNSGGSISIGGSGFSFATPTTDRGGGAIGPIRTPVPTETQTTSTIRTTQTTVIPPTTTASIAQSTPSTTASSGPGFTPAVALLVVALLAVSRRQ